MKIKDAIEQMKKLNPEAHAVFVCLTKADFDDYQLSDDGWKEIVIRSEEDDSLWAEFDSRLGEMLDDKLSQEQSQ